MITLEASEFSETFHVIVLYGIVFQYLAIFVLTLNKFSQFT